LAHIDFKTIYMEVMIALKAYVNLVLDEFITYLASKIFYQITLSTYFSEELIRPSL